MAAITVRAKAHTAAPIWATSYLHSGQKEGRQTDGWTDGRTDSPCSTGLHPLRGCCPKKVKFDWRTDGPMDRRTKRVVESRACD